MRVIDYITVAGDDAIDLDHRVKEHIDKGWQPIGGVCIQTFANDLSVFYQAMVKYAESSLSPDLDYRLLRAVVG